MSAEVFSISQVSSWGHTRRGNIKSDKRGGWGRGGGNSYNWGRQKYGIQRAYDYDPRPNSPPTFGHYNGRASGSYGGGGSSRDIGPHLFYLQIHRASSQSMPQDILSTNALVLQGLFLNLVP
jgi:hypothetical protein